MEEGNSGQEGEGQGVVVLPEPSSNDCKPSDNKEEIAHILEEFEPSFVTKYYFPFLLRAHNWILITWLIVFGVSVAFGPSFLSKTSSDVTLPQNLPSVKAMNAYNDNYPDRSSMPPIFILYHSKDPDYPVINEETKALAKSLDDMVSSYSYVTSVSGYWEFINDTALAPLASSFISPNNQTMLTTINFDNDVTDTSLTTLSDKLLKFAEKKDSATTFVGVTGLFPLFTEMQDATATNFELIDATVLPIGLILLGITIRSYKHVILALCNLACTVLFSFALMVPVSNAVSINPFSPTIMMSLGIAVCFDYCLFQLNRFKEEIVENKKHTYTAVICMLETSGHVIGFSAFILFLTFCILIIFPQQFLRSIGISCSCIVFSAAFVNLSLMPSFLLSCRWFSTFQMIPCVSDDRLDQLCSCWLVLLGNNIFSSKVDDDSRAHEQQQQQGQQQQQQGQQQGIKGAMNVMSFPRTHSTKSATSAGDNNNNIIVLHSRQNSIWFLMTTYVVKLRAILLTMTAVLTALLLWQVLTMIETSDNALIYLRGSLSLESYGMMREEYPIGRMDPYSILIDTHTPNGVYSNDYFTIESNIISIMLGRDRKYVSEESFTALSYYDESFVTYSEYLGCSTNTSLEYSTGRCVGYRMAINGLPNTESSVSMIVVTTIIDPDSEEITHFIDNTRKLLDETDSSTTIYSSTNHIESYLFGGYTTNLDLQRLLYSLVPYLIAATIIMVVIMVGIGFGGVVIALRLVVTVGVSLCWTYGMMAVVYQPGEGQRAFAKLTKSILTSSGVYWIIPIMSFSILTGLALDYDIFLMSRVIEIRKRGWSDTASVTLAIEKTGPIITTAGVIMAISFAGLLLPKSTVLNQYGFSLFFGVVVDTFFVRSILVPCVFSLFAKYNWWPRKDMPEAVLSEADEAVALLLGYEFPEHYKQQQEQQQQPQLLQDNNNNKIEEDNIELGETSTAVQASSMPEGYNLAPSAEDTEHNQPLAAGNDQQSLVPVTQENDGEIASI